MIGRRDLLGLGAGLAVVAAAASCRAVEPRTAPGAAPPSPDPTRRRPRRAPGPLGDVPRGSLYYGASVPYHRSLTSWERELGNRLAVNRSYFTPERNLEGQLAARCHDDLAHGRLPHVSIKPPATWQEVASGARDPWLTDLVAPLADVPGPVLLTLHHEPENEAGPPGMLAADFVAMQQHAIVVARELAPRVVLAPVLQHWTFDPLRAHHDPGSWIVPEAAVLGLDLYNPWSPSGRKAWRSFASKCDEVLPWLGETPLVIGEYGCREDPDNPGLAAEWLRDAAQYARETGILSMSYFNSHLNSPEGSWELERTAEAAFAELLASDWVARPT